MGATGVAVSAAQTLPESIDGSFPVLGLGPSLRVSSSLQGNM